MLTVDFELVTLSRTFFPQSSSHGADWAFIERRWNFQGHLLLSHDGGLWNRQRNGPGSLGRSLLLMLLWALGECSASVLLVSSGRSITEGWGFHSCLSCCGLYLFCEFSWLPFLLHHETPPESRILFLVLLCPYPKADSTPPCAGSHLSSYPFRMPVSICSLSLLSSCPSTLSSNVLAPFLGPHFRIGNFLVLQHSLMTLLCHHLQTAH